MDEKELQELVDNCIGDPESLRKLIEYLIEQNKNTDRALALRDKKFDRLLTLLGAGGKLTEIDKNDIKSQTIS